jgi:hypothetical protein
MATDDRRGQKVLPEDMERIRCLTPRFLPVSTATTAAQIASWITGWNAPVGTQSLSNVDMPSIQLSHCT